jgi:putative membrane protein
MSSQLAQYPVTLLWPPVFAVALALVGAAYIYLIGPNAGRRFGGSASWGETALFLSGLFLLWIGWGTPIHLIGEVYLFIAHMITMLIIAVFAPPLLIRGLPQSVVDWALGYAWVRRVIGLLTRPVLALGLFTVSLFAWHMPTLYDAAIRSDLIHGIQYAEMLIVGLAFWWPLTTKSQVLPRLKPVWVMGYTFGAIVLETVLFGPIMILEEPLYQTYKVAPRLIGLTALEDQQLGHLLMEVCSPTLLLIFFAMAFVQLSRESGAPVKENPSSLPVDGR